jgi:DNA-binding transcriptional MerR regulator
MAGLTISKFAAAEGVGVETVRFYQRKGLLAPPERPGRGYREYSEADRWRLAFIRRARRLGFTLAEISDLLGPAEARSTADIVRAAEARLAAVQEQLRELALTQCRLRRLVPAALEYTRWGAIDMTAADVEARAEEGVTRLVAGVSAADPDGQRAEISALAGRLGLG